MALFLLEAGAAERDALVDEDVVADFGGLAHHDPHPVIDEEAASDFRAGMNLDSCDQARQLAYHAAEQLAVMLPEPMRDAIEPDRVEAGVQENHLERGARGRVAVENRLDVFLHSAHNTHRRFLFPVAPRVKLSDAPRDYSRRPSIAGGRRCSCSPPSRAASHYPCAACIRPSQPAPAS